MKYLSICSGIEAASVAWKPLGWQAVGFSEIEKFPSAVLQYHYPDVPNFGDFTKITKETLNGESVDLLVGGTPCQDYSVAGKRAGMAGARGNLTLEFVKLAGRLRPRWLVWENVPGVLSSNGGRDFACFLRDLAECGYGFAYRILDVQYTRVQHGFPRGIPQHRERVFLIGHLGDWRCAAQVLFERESLFGHNPPKREKGKRVAPTLSQSLKSSGGIGMSNQELFSQGGGGLTFGDEIAEVSPTLDAQDGAKWGSNQWVAQGKAVIENSTYSIAGNIVNREDKNGPQFGTGVKENASFTMNASDVHAVCFPIDTQNMTEGHSSGGKGFKEGGESSFTLTKGHNHAVCYENHANDSRITGPNEVVSTLSARMGMGGGQCGFGTGDGISATGNGVAGCEVVRGFP